MESKAYGGCCLLPSLFVQQSVRLIAAIKIKTQTNAQTNSNGKALL